ncbi:RNA recognition motif domain-containing protein [Streptomyces cyaneofuscatus]|uniref:RNA recognition motif domain-containing protein n=1 Tax=Streptomyces cyaneofuscatus TaxID=66883 RepID=UPI0036463BC4
MPKLVIAGLPFQLEEPELRAAIGDFGQVASLQILKNESGNSKGVAFVEMSNAEEAAEVIKNMDGSTYHGRRISVVEADEKPKS